MCGIAGELRFNQAVVPAADWEKISALMARRGPNDQGIWTDHRTCTLVFRRLAIIDLSMNAHQPMTVQNGRYTLVFNGEIYNFQHLRKDLEGRGVRFRSTSDTEVVLYALIEWGVTALDRFNGMFALGFFDSVEKRLLLARDHAGMKPLYYLKKSEGMVFGSQYNQILAHPLSHNLEVSPEALGLYLRLAYIPAPFALMQDSNMLEPGSWVKFTADGQVEKGQYFTFPQYHSPKLKGQEALEAVDLTITAAVKRHLISDVPVGAFLSGGIDSPLVVAKMRSVSAGPIEVFTIGTGEKATDETQDAVAYAKEFGVKHRIECMDPAKALDFLDDVIESCGEPFGDYSIFPTMMVSRLASQNYKVMLSGDGGDELFWGYTGRFGSLVKNAGDFRYPFWWRWVWRGLKRVLQYGNYNHLNQRSLGSYHRLMLTHLSEKWLNQIFPSLPVWPNAYKAFEYHSCDPDRAAQYSRIAEFECHLPYVLMKVDRASMFHSLEVRVPLLDKEVIEIAAQTDWHQCLDVEQKMGKMVLRQVLSKYTKQQTQGKRGFEVPMGAWLRTSLREMVEESLLKRDEMLGLEVNKQALRRLYDLHLNGGSDLSWALWPLLSLSLWMNKHYQ
ncbi:asparagine synthase (glutamine-hydrolyzing) [Candidatus Nitrospira allomarina]|uniref:asparagine synthase (glutamine-hydrolyzing) n=1 Tax=Candidatus Nitrospira allomarina TaxID=3020900 RepID=A0AA96GI43_9BACT|nr:asparagine synthase (glutamine-hydrolyzing) [Candidatus Nitrospira allomarina]WNM58136.1 asparagine synthase (glutamine-hydrolyzing) [Candidatus Nitrospira allomarina]